MCFSDMQNTGDCKYLTEKLIKSLRNEKSTQANIIGDKATSLWPSGKQCPRATPSGTLFALWLESVYSYQEQFCPV